MNVRKIARQMDGTDATILVHRLHCLYENNIMAPSFLH